jgi:hypothetical protein
MLGPAETGAPTPRSFGPWPVAISTAPPRLLGMVGWIGFRNKQSLHKQSIVLNTLNKATRNSKPDGAARQLATAKTPAKCLTTRFLA